MQQNQMIKLVEQISISEHEQDIFNIFLKFKEHAKLTTTYRVAGGWVRDKLMGLDSHDIDIALDNMMGAEFVTLMNEYLNSHNEKTGGFGVTKFNPDKSKHLETACVRIKDTWIDVVNLRGETYTENSRVPTIEIGTPEQDAYRRDLTINSMFYNINTKQIEDFTKQGRNDLQSMIIRTPVDPLKTFLDDPLRVLRTFRFATRFQFNIVNEIYQAINQDVKTALKLKVSKERVGIELTWMLQSDQCLIGLKQYHSNNLWDVIFETPAESTVRKEDQGKIQIQSFLLSEIVSNHQQKNLQQLAISTGLDKKFLNFYMNLTAICLPYHSIQYKNGKNMISIVNYIVAESLKMPKKETTNILLICDQIQVFNAIKRQSFDISFNNIIRFIQTAGIFWELIVYLDFCMELLENPNENYKIYQNFIETVYSRHLEKFYEVKPLVDGMEISKIYKIKPGPEIKLILSNCLIWQASNYGATKEELIAAIQQNNEQFLLKQI